MVSATSNNPTENFVTCIHTTKFADTFHDVVVTWAKTLINHSLYITVQNPDDENYCTCKIDLKTWQFWGKKGLRTFKVDDRRVEVFWDLRSAKFANSPEPDSNYYVALVCEGDVVLLLGDQKKEAFKRTKCGMSLQDSWLLHKREIVFAKKCFCTKTSLGKGSRDHTIVIESALSCPSGPEMWIGVDGIELIRVSNLHWRFRGNETILVDHMPVQVMWDVHDWLYSCQNSGAGIFIFKQGVNESELGIDYFEDEEVCKSSCGMVANNHSSSMGFCHFVYAWKTE